MLTRKLTLSIPSSERQRFADTGHSRIMEETKSIDKANIVLGIFLDSMTTNFSNQVMIDEQVKDSLKEDNKQKADASISPLLPQEPCLLPYQRPAQSD